MANWMVYAFGTALVLAGADFFVKLASGKISNSLAFLIYGTCTFLAGLGWVMWQRSHHVQQFAQPAGILAALGVGLAFSAVTSGLYITFGAGAPISLASPLIRLGGLLLASLAGILLLGEPLTFRYIAGVLFAVLGIYLIITR
jgi:drug/metabolite transporter (DMT)-like permease